MESWENKQCKKPAQKLPQMYIESIPMQCVVPENIHTSSKKGICLRQVDRKQFQCLQIVFNNKTKSLVLEFD